MFDPEMLSKMMEDDEHTPYAIDLRARYGTSPVIDRLNASQLNLSDLTANTSELRALWNEAQSDLKELEVEMKEQGLIGQIVTLSGTGIEIPKLETVLTHSITMITLVDADKLDAATIEAYYRNDEVRGILSGVTLRFDQVDDDTYVPRFAYQVATATHDTPHSHTTLYATGVVGRTAIEFYEDRRMDALVPLLENLYSLCGDNYEAVNTINRGLSDPTVLDVSRFRHIAYHAEKMINGLEGDTQPIEDAVAELVLHYLERGQDTYLKTEAFVYHPTKEEPASIPYNATEYDLRGILEDVTFFDEAIVEDVSSGEGVLSTDTGQRKMHIVLRHADQQYSAPITQLSEYSTH